MTHPATKRRLLTFGSALALLSLLLIAFGPSNRADAASFQPGVVTVTGYNWSVSNPAVNVNLPQDGQSSYTVEQILEEAQPSAGGQFDVATIPGISIQKPNGSVVSCTGNQVRAGNDACPVFTATTTATTMQLQGGSKVTFDVSTNGPVIRIDQPKDMTVTVSPAKKTVQTGTTVNFTAQVSNKVGTLTYKWDFGDGTADRTTTSNEVSHKFTGDNEKFSVVLTVTSTANPRSYYGSALITVGKVKQKPEKNDNSKDKNKSGGNGSGSNGGTGNGSNYYVPGYTGGYGGYTGGSSTGPSSPAPSTGDQKPKKQKQDKQPADDGLQTVSGQLIDPASVASAIPSTGDQSGATEQANPADDSSGGGVPGGIKAALGIGALLGLGGLAEAGAFAGGLGRLRFRP